MPSRRRCSKNRGSERRPIGARQEDEVSTADSSSSAHTDYHRHSVAAFALPPGHHLSNAVCSFDRSRRRAAARGFSRAGPPRRTCREGVASRRRFVGPVREEARMAACDCEHHTHEPSAARPPTEHDFGAAEAVATVKSPWGRTSRRRPSVNATATSSTQRPRLAFSRRSSRCFPAVWKYSRETRAATPALNCELYCWM